MAGSSIRHVAMGLASSSMLYRAYANFDQPAELALWEPHWLVTGRTQLQVRRLSLLTI